MPSRFHRGRSLLCSTSMVWNSGCRDCGPFRVQQLDEVLEGHVLVRVGRQVDGPDAVDQRAQARRAGDIGSQHQRVQEAADQIMQRRVVAARNGRADRNVFAGSESRQQRGQPGLQHHEQRRMTIPRDAVPARPEHRRSTRPAAKPPDTRRSPAEADRPATAISGRQPGERLAPELPPALPRSTPTAATTHSPRTAPATAPSRASRRHARRIGRRQVRDERRPRPTVPGDVLQHEHQQMRVGRARSTPRPAAAHRPAGRSPPPPGPSARPATRPTAPRRHPRRS